MTTTLLNQVLLYYLRHFPVDHLKDKLAQFISLDGKQEVQYENAFGLKFHLDLTDYVQRCIFLYDRYERNTVRHACKLMRPDMNIIDVGANIGAYSLFFSRFAPHGTVYALEPLSYAYEKLLANMKLNECPNIRAFKLAAGDSKERASIYYGQENHNFGGASFFKLLGSQVVSEEVDVIRLDDFIERERIGKVDILKVDVEGWDKAVLDGAANLLKKVPRLILILELIDANLKKFGARSAGVFRELTELGFKAYRPRGWPFGLEPLSRCPEESYFDNVFFLKGY